MFRRIFTRLKLTESIAKVLFLAALLTMAALTSAILLPHGVKLPVIIAFLALGLVLMTVIAAIMAIARDNAEQTAQHLRVRLNQVQRFADDLIENDTVFQNDLIQINTRLNQRMVRLLRLLDVSKRLVSTYNPEAVVQNIVDSVSEIVGYGFAVLEISDPRVGGLGSKLVYESGKTDKDIRNDRSFELSAPLEVGGVRIGLLRLITDKVNSGTPEDIQTLSTLATYAAIALENSRLYTALTAVNKDLSALKDYNEDVVESVAGGLIVLDKSFKVSTWNTGMEQISGIKRDQALGRNLFHIFSSLPDDLLQKLVVQTLADRKPRDMRNYTFTTPSGKEFIGYVKISALSPRERDVAGVILSIEDVTEKARLGEQLRHAERMRTVGEFAAGIAHEINNPIGIISACSEYLARKAEEQAFDSEKFASRLRIIQEEATRCSAIIKKLLVFARQSGFKRTSVDLTSLISDAMMLVSPRANKDQIEVVLSLEDIPSVIGDEQQLKQVFLNIVLNALEASSPGGCITISTRFVERSAGDPVAIKQFISSGSADISGYVEVSVSDEGPGIRPEDMDRIFNPFFTTKPDGVGLGLAISYSIIESHGGQILATNNPSGKGCTFTVRLPVVASTSSSN